MKRLLKVVNYCYNKKITKSAIKVGLVHNSHIASIVGNTIDGMVSSTEEAAINIKLDDFNTITKAFVISNVIRGFTKAVNFDDVGANVGVPHYAYIYNNLVSGTIVGSDGKTYQDNNIQI